jgi:membrane protein insertase Oxa1/YidC/SpoIIIJ
MPSSKDARKLRDILKDANTGKQADNAEVSAAMGRNMSYVLPLFIFVVTVGFPAALSLYWFVGGLIAYMQQSYLLKQDEYAMTGPEATVVSKKPLKKETKAEARKNAGVKVTTLSEETKSKTDKPKTKTTSKKNRKKRRK